jgi:hypothetical protein
LQYIKEGKATNIRLLLKILKHLPVSVEDLRSSAIGKAVNKLKTFPDSKVVTRSDGLVKQWKTLVTNVAEQQVKGGNTRQCRRL